MKVYLRIKWRALGITFGVTRHAWGVSYDSLKGFAIGPLPEPSDATIDTAQKLVDKWGVKLAVSAVTV